MAVAVPVHVCMAVAVSVHVCMAVAVPVPVCMAVPTLVAVTLTADDSVRDSPPDAVAVAVLVMIDVAD